MDRLKALGAKVWSLPNRKRLAAPVYRIGWRLIRLADKIDGKQPRK